MAAFVRVESSKVLVLQGLVREQVGVVQEGARLESRQRVVRSQRRPVRPRVERLRP